MDITINVTPYEQAIIESEYGPLGEVLEGHTVGLLNSIYQRQLTPVRSEANANTLITLKAIASVEAFIKQAAGPLTEE